MPMRRAIGISLMCLVTSACAIAETTEGSATQPACAALGNAEGPSDKPRSSACEAQERQSADDGSEPMEQRRESFAPVTDGCEGVLCCGLVHAAGGGQLGKAAWYDFVGKQTASGEILDRFTATAAHRSLPLASYAKVTNLHNSRSVIVKINDRGPYARGLIIDLSPRAADVLDMKRAGVVAVDIEPLVYRMAPTVTAFQTSDTTVAQ